MDVPMRTGKAGILASLLSMTVGVVGAAGDDPLKYWLGIIAMLSGILAPWLAPWVKLWFDERKQRRAERRRGLSSAEGEG
jgi:hypothetical protein